MLMEDSSDEDIIENDSDDNEEDQIEVKIDVSDIEEADLPTDQPENLQVVENELEQVSSDDDDVPLAHLFMVRDKDKNIIKWKTYPSLPRNVRTRAENIVLQLPGPVREGKTAKTDLECFSLLEGGATFVEGQGKKHHEKLVENVDISSAEITLC
ncbi:uncharacterized protein LOC128988190 isoform X1 [Macrosteles quadrilineatus]|uniref:uncharacterized protein LOC128988190 isoform X1 n=1 Tax=Macrosteles quadrilineatus TaxID=74068 RepID=UPI0023E1E8BB|nr:uncharacterized protein LOC128988190 isoform X1 [Macrosteles quadrilineatus]